MFRRQLATATFMVLAFTVICGLAYPLIVVGVGQAAFPSKANGSSVSAAGRVVGSSMLAQGFSGATYFHPRPSAAGPDGYDALASSASNLGPSNPKLIEVVWERVDAYRSTNDLQPDAAVPIDAVTASASGLDPHISVANARLQAPRVAAQRHIPLDRVLEQVDAHTTGRALGILGEPGVNVLELNLALDNPPPG